MKMQKHYFANRDLSPTVLSQELEEKAQQLRSRAHQIARNLFQSGDLSGFLDLVCRLHYYDAYNLLLILQQYPQATCLASMPIWKKQFHNRHDLILKKEFWGKAIELIVPFILGVDDSSATLVWYGVKQWDISQTNYTGDIPLSSSYIPDNAHPQIILESLAGVIASEYHRSVVPIASFAQLQSTGLPGYMSDFTIQIREDISPMVRIHFLCDCLCQLSIQKTDLFTTPQITLAIECVIHCLFRIWFLDQPKRFIQNTAVLDSISPELQMEFLSLIQRTVRSLDESIAAFYCGIREEEIGIHQ